MTNTPKESQGNRLVFSLTNNVFSMVNCALYYPVYYGFVQTIPRQITANNERITETMELPRLLLTVRIAL